MKIEIYIFFLLVTTKYSLAVNTVYLSTSCNQTTSVSTGISLQSSTALVYSNSMSCYYVVNVQTGYKVVAVFRRYEFEEKLNNACLDYVNFYDGTSTSAALMNSDPYCGSTAPTNITSTGTSLTVEMITDSSGVYRGFDLLLSAFTDAPCSSDQFACSNGLCISSTLACDNYNQCGDESDESSCTAEELAGITAKDNAALVAGLVIGLGSFVIIAVLVGIYIYRQYRWKLFLKDPLPVIQQWDMQNNYPLTKNYYKFHNNEYPNSRNGYGTGTDISSPQDRPSTPNSGQSSSKGILKNSHLTHSNA